MLVLFRKEKNARPFFKGALRSLSGQRGKSERGSVLFYIFLAIGLLGALTYSFVKDSRQNTTSQISYKSAEELYVQANVIRAAIMECAIEYPSGGGDLDADGDIDATDNPNNPYPVNPSNANNPHGVAANNNVRNLSCTGAPAGRANIFQGANNKGRLLPPPPPDFGEWTYINDANGVRIQITGNATAGATDALTRLMTRFVSCQADLNYGACGARCFTAWIQRTACP